MVQHLVHDGVASKVRISIFERSQSQPAVLLLISTENAGTNAVVFASKTPIDRGGRVANEKLPCRCDVLQILKRQLGFLIQWTPVRAY